MTYSLEKEMFKNKIKAFGLDQAVFVTGLARAGTTILFNTLFDTNSFASLKYSNMPFLLMPNLWKRLHYSEPTPLEERSHSDGIMVNNQSPEAFDEYFWKVFLNDKYISDKYLIPHNITDNILAEYLQYIKLVCYSQNKSYYISKNNNNILRLHSLSGLNIHKKILLLFRHPAEHAMSLLKEHQLFSRQQKKDPFSLEYFDFIGHHEFGLHHKPFLLHADDLSKMAQIPKENPDYWLFGWKSYYSYVLKHLTEDTYLISFDDICNNSLLLSEYLKEILNLVSMPAIPERKKHSDYSFSFNPSLLQDCMDVYGQLSQLRKY